jgi:UDP-N-acetylglucosamine--N-acetylmuramyl-(pentapeptide) pyrophosphoryl-undecaprenol N-acetylglucosamine transferase
MRVAIACGGTGGHFYPGYALARELRERGHETLFLVRDGDPARGLLEAESLACAEIRLRGLSRRPSWSWLTILPRTLGALRTLRRAFRAYRPDVFVGMGAYLTGASAVAARLSGVPVVLHEANARLGLANGACARFADALALGLPLVSEAHARVGTALTGTPIRGELHKRGDSRPARKALGLDPELKTILVLGGSQGARALNTRIPAGLALASPRVQAYHLCGKDRAAETADAYAKAGMSERVVVAEYDSDMARAYAAADAVVCRAGASTAAELLAQRLPAVLVPYPYAAEDHQAANAEALVRAGLGVLLREESLSSESLKNALESLPNTPSEDPAEAIGLPPAAQSARRLADVVEKAAKN